MRTLDYEVISSTVANRNQFIYIFSKSETDMIHTLKYYRMVVQETTCRARRFL